MRLLNPLIWIALIGVSSFAAAETFRSQLSAPVIIELYTSEGCSSCPPAERWLNQFKDHSGLWHDVFPIAWHVDYWDSIGWPDRFAKPGHGVRQWRYKRDTPLRSVYTPGVLVNGSAWRGWRRGAEPAAEAGDAVGVLQVDLREGHFSARFSPAEPEQEGPVLSLALLGFGLSTEVRRGENAGRHLNHEFVVLASRRFGEGTGWSGAIPDAGIFADDVQRLAVVFWLERDDSPVPIQMAGGWLTEEQ